MSVDMSSDTSPAQRRLKLVGPGDALSGVAPIAFERATKRCAVGSPLHRGLVRIAALLGRHGVGRVIAPSARSELEAGLMAAEAWANDAAPLKLVRRERSACFEALPKIQEATFAAVRISLERAPKPEQSALSAHAERIVWRYVRLAARLCGDAVLLTLDGVTEPARLAPVVQQVAAARAYQATGLGSARNAELLSSARDQATFEVEHLEHGHAEELLALQILHEYLGVRWKVLHDAERAYIEQFVNWASAAFPDAG
jgi:hypothetical protein